MNKQFELKIITPTGRAFEGLVTSVSCPGAAGRFQVLFNHAPLLSSLDVGPLVVVAPEGTQTFAVSGGFAQVYRNTMLILAETAERHEDIDVNRAREAKKRAEERLEKHRREIDVERAEFALYRAINRLKVAGSR